jgi:hypothetical protein
MIDVVETEIDEELIRQHVEMIHQQAAQGNAEGKLVIASFGEDPTTGKPLSPKIVHVRVGDVDCTVDEIVRLSRQPYRNVYMPLAVFRADLPPGNKGREDDIVAVLGLVADFDDPDAACWGDRLPVEPSCVLETSSGRFQAFYAFDKPEPVKRE